ncbi:hypothetical protein [Dongia deserti]|uniref:hypothetical protein n=1 Tax=Dongia deserti TaxID=2268030 RepID=UPI0013C50589|nr:hypothetical protein [Dongia deserti]
MPRRDKERDKPAVERDSAGHFIESNEPSAAQPELAKENAETRRRAAKSPPKGGEGDKGDSRRRKLRT